MKARHHMIHPGPVNSFRVNYCKSTVIKAKNRVGEAAQTLESALKDAIAGSGATSGNGTLRDCALSTTRFTTGGPARDGKSANYTYIRDWNQSVLVEGTFTFGLDELGDSFVHCHGIIEAENGLIAGHLFPRDCLISSAFDAQFNLLIDIQLIQQSDPETLHSVFNLDPHMSGGDGALFVRIRPNEDVTEALQTACAHAGIANATIAPSIGSLNAPLLDSGPCESVGMEVIAFEGHIRDGVADVFATLCDENGQIYRGQLVPGGASICVTAEIVLLTDA